MATQEWHAQHTGLHGPLPAPPAVQRAGKGGSLCPLRQPRASKRHLLLPARQQIRVKGLSYGGEQAGWWLGRCRSHRQSQQSALFGRRNSLAGACVDKVTGGLTVNHAQRLIRQCRLQAKRRWPIHSQNNSDAESDAGESTQQHDCTATSHPISVPSSLRTSEAGSSRISETGSTSSRISAARSSGHKVQGLPELPARKGPTAASREDYRRRAEISLRLLREFLRRDYAIGYLMLGWLLHTTWVLVPGVAKLLGLPQPDDAATRVQLPVLAAWLLDGANCCGVQLSEQESKEVLLLLTPEELQHLQEQLTSPRAAATSLGSFLQAQQTLVGAPATAQQVAEYLRKEQQLQQMFRGVDLPGNLASGSSAAATMAQLSATQKGVAANASAAAVLGQQLAKTQQHREGTSHCAAAESALEAMQQGTPAATTFGVTGDASCGCSRTTGPDAVAKNSPEGPAAADAVPSSSIKVAVLAGATSTVADTVADSAADSLLGTAVPGLGSVLVELTSQVGRTIQRVLPQLASSGKDSSGAAAMTGAVSSQVVDPSALLQQLQALQQRLPAYKDKASMLQDYQAWLDQVKDCLVQQHEVTQVHLSQLKSELVLAASSLRQSHTHKEQVEQQQIILQHSKQQALEKYQQASKAISCIQQQLASGGDIGELTPGGFSSAAEAVGDLGTVQAEAEIAKADLAAKDQQLQQLHGSYEAMQIDTSRVKAQLAELQSSYNQVAAAFSDQTSARHDLDVAIASLDAAVAGVADNTDKAQEELDALMQLLLGQLKQVEWNTAAAAGAVAAPTVLSDALDAPAATEALDVATAAAAHADHHATAAVEDDGRLIKPNEPLPVALQVVDSTEDGISLVGATLLAQADSIIEQAEQTIGSSSGAGRGQQQQQPNSAGVLQATSKRILVPPTPTGFSQAAVLFVERLHQPLGDQSCLPAAGVPAEAAESIAGADRQQLSPPSTHHPAESEVRPVHSNDMQWWAQHINQADWAAQADLLSSWANRQLSSGLEATQQVAAAAAKLQSEAAAAAARAAAAAGEAKQRVDGKGPNGKRSLKEEVLAASGLLSLISPAWWTEEALGGSSTHSAGPMGAEALSTSKIRTAGDAADVLQEAYGSDGSGMDGGGASGQGSGPRGGGDGGSGNGNDDDSSPDDGSGGNDSGSGKHGSSGGSGGGSGPSGPSGPWDGFEHFPPPGGLDPVVLLPVVFVAVAASLPSLFGSAGSTAAPTDSTNQGSSSLHAVPAALAPIEAIGSSKSGSRGGHKFSMHQQLQNSTGAMGREERLKAMTEATAAAAERASRATAAGHLQGMQVPDDSEQLLTSAAAAGHLYRHNPAADQPVLTFARQQEAASASGSIQDGVHDSNSKLNIAAVIGDSSLSGTRGTAGAAHAVAGTAPVGHTNQQVAWDELEELPLLAKQEILSLRAVVSGNKHQQRALQKQLQATQQQLAAKEAELAGSAAKTAQLQAELSAALSDLSKFTSGKEVPAKESSSAANAASISELRRGYQQQISLLSQRTAAANTAAASQVAALQAQLDIAQGIAAEAVADLEARLSKVVLSKGKLQRDLELKASALQVELTYSQQGAASWQVAAEVARAQLAAAQEQLSTARAEAAEQLQQSQALLLGEQEAKHSLQEKLEAAIVPYVANEQQLRSALQASQSQCDQLTAELATTKANLATSHSQVEAAQQQMQQLSALQQQQLEDMQASKQQVANLFEELTGVRAGYQPLIAGLEQELAAERSSAVRQVTQLKGWLAAAEQDSAQQMQRMHAQLAAAEASCLDASSRAEQLQQQLDSMQQHAGLQEELTAAQDSLQQLGSDLQLIQAREQARSTATNAAPNGRTVSTDDQVLSLQLTTSEHHTQQLQQELESAAAEAQQHVITLQAQITELQQQHSTAATVAAQELERACLKSHQQAESLRQQLKDERAAAAAKLKAVAHELEGVRGGYTTFVAELEHELHTERSSATRQVAELKEELQQVQQQLDASTAQLATARAAAEAAAAAAAQELQAQVQHTSELQQQLQQLNADKAQLESETATLHSTSQAQLQELMQQTEQLKQQEQEALQRCSDLDVQLAEQQASAAARISKLEAQVSELQQSCERLTAELAAVTSEGEDEVVRLRAEVATQRADMTKQVQALQALSSEQESSALAQIKHLQQVISEQTTLAEQLRQELQQQAATSAVDMQDAQAGFARFTQGLEAELRDSRDSHQQRLTELHSLLLTAREEKGQLAAALQLLNGAIGGGTVVAGFSSPQGDARSASPAAGAVEAAAADCVTASVAVAQQLHADITNLGNAKHELQARINQLEQQLVNDAEQHDQQVQQLQQQLAGLRADLAGSEAQCQSLEQQIQDKAAAVAAAEAQAQDLSEQLQDAGSAAAGAMATLQTENDTLNQQLSQLRAELAAEEADLESLRTAVAAAEARVQAATSSIQAIQQEAAAGAAVLQGQLQVTRQQLLTLQLQVDEKTAMLEANALSITELRVQLAAAVEESSCANATVAALTDQLHSATQQLAVLQQTHDQQQFIHDEASEQQLLMAQDTAQRLQLAEASTHKLESDLQSAQATAAEQSAQLQHLQQLLQDSNNKFMQLQHDRQQDEAAAVTAQGKLSEQLQQQQQVTNALQEQLTPALSAADQQQSELRQQLQQAEASLHLLQSQQGESAGAQAALEARLAAATSQVTELQQELDTQQAAAEATKADLQKRLAESEALVQQLQRQLAESQIEATSSKDEVRRLQADAATATAAATAAAASVASALPAAAGAVTLGALRGLAGAGAVGAATAGSIVSQLQQQVGQLTGQHSRLQSDYQKQAQELSSVRQLLQEQQTTAAWERDGAAAAASTAALNLQHLSKQAASAKQEAELHVAEVVKLSESLAAAETRTAVLQAELGQLHSRHIAETSSLEQELEAASSQCEELQQQLKAATAEVQQHQQQLAAAEEHHEVALAALQAELATAVAAANEHTTRLETQLTEARDAALVGNTAAAKATQEAAAAGVELQAAVSDLNKQATSHAAAVAALEADHAAAMAAAANAAASETSLLHGGHVAAIQGLQQEHATAIAQLQQQHTGQISALQEQHKSALSQLDTQHAEQVNQLQQRLTAVTAEADQMAQELKQQHASAMAAVYQEHQATLSAVDAASRSALDQLRAEHATSIAELESKQQAEKAELGQHMAAAKAAATQQLQQLQQQHDHAVATLEAQHAAVLAATNAAASGQVTEASSALANLEAQYTAQVKQLKEQLAAAAAAAQQDLSAAKSSHADTVAELEVKHAAKLSELKQQMALAADLATADVQNLQHCLQEAEAAHAAAEGSAKQQAAVVTDLESQLAVIREQSQQQLAELVRQHAAATAVSATEIEALKTQLTAQTAALTAAAEEKEQLLQQLSVLRLDLAAAAAAYESKVADLRQQLDAAKHGLEDNIQQMETAANDLAAVDARHKQLAAEMATIQAERDQLHDRCQQAEKQLAEVQHQQSQQHQQLAALRMQLPQAEVSSAVANQAKPRGLLGAIAAAVGAAATGESGLAKEQLRRQSSDLPQLSAQISDMVAHSNEQQRQLDDLSAQLTVSRGEADRWQAAADAASQQQQQAEAAQQELHQQLQLRMAEVTASAVTAEEQRAVQASTQQQLAAARKECDAIRQQVRQLHAAVRDLEEKSAAALAAEHESSRAALANAGAVAAAEIENIKQHLTQTEVTLAAVTVGAEAAKAAALDGELQLKQQLLEAETARDAAKDKVVSMSMAADTAAAELAALQQHYDDLAAQLATAAEDRSAAAAQCDVQQGRIAELESHQQQLTSELQASVQHQQQLNMQLAEAQDKYSSVQADLAAVQKKSDAQQLFLQEQLHSLTALNDKSQGQLSRVTAAMMAQIHLAAQLDQQIAEMEQLQQLTDLSAASKHQQLEQCLQEYASAAASAAADVVNIEQQFSKLQDQYAAAREELTEARAAAVEAACINEGLIAARTELQNHLAVATADRDQLDSRCSGLQEHSEALTSVAADLRAQIQFLQQQVLSIECSSATASKEAAEARQALLTAQQQLQDLQQQLVATAAEADTAKASRKQAEARVLEVQEQLAALQKELQESKQRLTEADETQRALTLQLLGSNQEVKLLKEHSSESGHSWRLGAGSNTNSGGGAGMEAALAEARHQLSSWEQDVLSLEFVATHESFEDVADLDMTYNNSHLEVVHRAVLRLRKAAAEVNRMAANTSISRLSSGTGDAVSPRSSFRTASPSSNASSPRSSAAAKLAALEAQAGKATSRSLAVGTALDSSLQAMQAAKQSLLSMHNNDLKLELISQSVQEVLAGKSLNAPLSSIVNSIGSSGGGSAQTDEAASTGLLSTQTTQEADAFVARLASTSEGGTSMGLGSHIGIGTIHEEAASPLNTAEQQQLAEELLQYRQQVEELVAAKMALQEQLETAAAATGQLAAVQAAKEAAAAENEQLILQVQILSQEAEGLQHTAEQLAEMQAANAELTASKQALEASMSGLQAELVQLRQQRELFEQQSSKVVWLEDEVIELQGQLDDLMRQNRELAEQLAAARAEMHGSRDGALVPKSNDAAVSAVRAVTQSLLLHSAPFEISIDEEQMMLPTDADDNSQLSTRRANFPSKEATIDSSMPSSLQPLQQPLVFNSPALQAQQIGRMWSSEANEDSRSKPSSAEGETDYMHYSNTARMAQSMLEGNSRRPALPTTEEDTPDVSQQQQQQHPSTLMHAGANAGSAISTVSTGGVVASSTGPRGRPSAVHSQEYDVVIVPGKEDSAASVEGAEAKQLAQRALGRLRQEDSGENRVRNSWPGADLKSIKHSQDLVSVAHDISKLGEISSELAEQQVVVQQQLAASQALAKSMREQAAAHNVSMEEVVGHFFNVYNIACFVAVDRERVLDLLIDARAEQQNQASQLAQRSSQIQQLASDRDLALQKLWHSEEKLVALESQLSELEQQVQDKQEELAAKAAALDVAKCATGPLAGLTAAQSQQLQTMLAEANQIVSQQRGTVQDALERWKRSSGGDDSAADCLAAGDSSNQLAWLQQEQRQLMQELSSLSVSSSSSQASIRDPKATDTDQQQLVLAASNSKGGLPQGFLPDAASAALQKMPAEVSAYVSALAQRMAAMQTLTEHISAEVVRKHEEAVALQASFMQIEVAKQLLENQLQEQAAESAKLRQQLQHLEGVKRGVTLTPKSYSDSPSRHSGIAGNTRAGGESVTAEPVAEGPVSVLDADLQPLKRGYVLGVAQQFEPDIRKATSLPSTAAEADSMDEAVVAATRVVRREATSSPAAPASATPVSRTASLTKGLPPLVLPESDGSTNTVAAASSPATGATPGAVPDRQLAQTSSTATPRSAGLSAFGRSLSFKSSPAASPRTSALGKLETSHPIWVPAAIASSPRTSAVAVTSPKSPASPILSPAAREGLGVSRKDSGSAGGVAKKPPTQQGMGFGSSSPTKRSAIPTLSTATSAGGSSRMSASTGPGGLSRIPGVAGAMGSSAVGSGSSSKIGSGASSPAMSPGPVAAVAAAAGDRSSPVFRSSRAVGSAAGRAVGGSSTGGSMAGSLSASTCSVGSAEGKGSRVGGSPAGASKAVGEAGKGASSGSSSPLKSRTIPSKK